MSIIYLDNATVAKRQDVSQETVWGEKTSAYGLMHGVDKAFEQANERLHTLFSMDIESRYLITSSFEDIPKTIVRSSGRKKISVYLSDSNAVLDACDQARGDIDVSYFREKEDPENSLFFVQYVHPLTGVITSVESLEEAKRRDCSIALDVSYAVGKVSLEGVLELADYIMVRGEAIGAPFGLSLVAARNAPLEKRTTQTNQLMAFLHAFEQELSQELFFTTEVARLKAIFEEGEDVSFSAHMRAPHISCMTFKNVKNELLLFTLARRGLFATIGGGPFPLLDSMTSLSFCFGSDIDEQTVVEAKKRLRRAVNELQVISEGVL